MDTYTEPLRKILEAPRSSGEGNKGPGQSVLFKAQGPKLIGLYSRTAGSGKTETANILTRDFGYTCRSFASPIKAMLETLFKSLGLSRAEIKQRLYGSRKGEIVPALGVTSRFLMEKLGTDWGRDMVNPTIWVTCAMREVDIDLKYAGWNIVIDDLRRPDEYLAIKEAGGVVIEVVRTVSAVDRSKYEGLLEGYAFDATIPNYGSLSDLKATVTETIKSLGDDE